MNYCPVSWQENTNNDLWKNSSTVYPVISTEQGVFELLGSQKTRTQLTWTCVVCSFMYHDSWAPQIGESQWSARGVGYWSAPSARLKSQQCIRSVHQHAVETCLSFPIRHILSVSHKKKMERIILSQNIWYFPLDAVMVLNYRYRISDHRTDHEISFPLNF